jgi:hypothetical protein
MGKFFFFSFSKSPPCFKVIKENENDSNPDTTTTGSNRERWLYREGRFVISTLLP